MVAQRPRLLRRERLPRQRRRQHCHTIRELWRVPQDLLARGSRRRDHPLAGLHVTDDHEARGGVHQAAAQWQERAVVLVLAVQSEDQRHAPAARQAGSLAAEQDRVLRVDDVQTNLRSQPSGLRRERDGNPVEPAALPG